MLVAPDIASLAAPSGVGGQAVEIEDDICSLGWSCYGRFRVWNTGEERHHHHLIDSAHSTIDASQWTVDFENNLDRQDSYARQTTAFDAAESRPAKAESSFVPSSPRIESLDQIGQSEQLEKPSRWSTNKKQQCRS